MSDDTPTRRSVLKTGAALTLGALAGCTQSTDEGASTETTSGGDPTPTEAATTAAGEDTATATEGGPYTVSIEPMGEVTFQSVPETWVANNGSWADMGIALGQDPPEGVWLTSRYHTHYYDAIPGVSVDTEGMRSLYQDGVGQEQFYDMNADVHVMDPNFMRNRFDWTASDVADIRELAPFFGNSIFSTGYDWHDYPYYTLYEAFGKLAEAFQEQERYRAFVQLHEEFQSSLDDVVPPQGDRPAIAVMWAAGNEPAQFSPYLIGEGTSFKQWRDLGVRDALAETGVRDFHQTRGRVDFETLLEIDPQYLMFRGHEGQTRQEFENTLVAYLENHEIGSQLTAVQEGNVHRGGPLYQGPITNLVVSERAARQVYDVETELFDRQRVANIVAGEF